MKGVSVIVCCYNSAQRLPKVLLHLSRQQLQPGIAWELLIVNNRSTDNTREIALQEWKKHASPCPLSIIEEERQGLCFAREKGIRAAQYDFVIFCDDDNWLQETYLQRAYDILNLDDSIGIAGGQSIAITDGDFPAWFERFKEGYAVGKQAERSKCVTKERGYLWGAGIAIRRQVLMEIMADGWQSLLTGRRGNAITSGDDAEICKWYIKKGYDLWYDEALCFSHFIPQQRLTWEYCWKLYQSFGTSQIKLALYDFNHQQEPFQSWWKKLLLAKAKEFFSYFSIANCLKLMYAIYIAKPEGQVIPLKLATLSRQSIYLMLEKRHVQKSYQQLNKFKSVFISR